MKKTIIILLSAILTAILITGFLFKDKLKLLHASLHAFKKENLAWSFQHMAQIQPTRRIEASGTILPFRREETPLPKSFRYKNEEYLVDSYLEKTKTAGFLVIKDDVIRHEAYLLGSNEKTLFSSNSMGKSFVSALMGIAIEEGYIQSVEESISTYIPKLKGSRLADIPIKACLRMASGIDFDEDKDMSGYSVKTLLGIPAMNLISKLDLMEKPCTYRRYLSINTEILGTVISNATGMGLADYMQQKLWSKIGAEQDAYWTLNNGRELAMGGLNITLRDYARFGRLYLKSGVIDKEPIVPAHWIKDSLDCSAAYSKPGANNDSYNAIGYGYQWWIPAGSEGEFMAIGVYSQWIYVNPAKQVIIVKTSADPSFMEPNYEQTHIELFRAVANAL